MEVDDPVGDPDYTPNGKAVRRHSSSVICEICSHVKDYKNPHLAKIYGSSFCVICRRFLSKCIELTKVPKNAYSLKCVLNLRTRRCAIPPDTKYDTRCRACWLSICLDKCTQLPDDLRYALSSLLTKNGKLSNSLNEIICCGICGNVRNYKFSLQSRKYGLKSCEPCRRFILEMTRYANAEGNSVRLVCAGPDGYLKCPITPSTSVNHAGKRCKACWLTTCIDRYNMPEDLRVKLSDMIITDDIKPIIPKRRGRRLKIPKKEEKVVIIKSSAGQKRKREVGQEGNEEELSAKEITLESLIRENSYTDDDLTIIESQHEVIEIESDEEGEGRGNEYSDMSVELGLSDTEQSNADEFLPTNYQEFLQILMKEGPTDGGYDDEPVFLQDEVVTFPLRKSK